MQIGVLGGLLILFIALKLFGAITWSWWWVASPLWIGAALYVVAVVVAVIGEVRGPQQ
jgi:hypothetical protein